jgi:hypothetical protein
MIAPFEASKLKVSRAARHLSELEIAVTAYLAEKPCVIVVEPFPYMQGIMPASLRHACMARADSEPVPLDLSAMIGDVVHNLRSTLDLLACDGKGETNPIPGPPLAWFVPSSVARRSPKLWIARLSSRWVLAIRSKV